MTDVSIPSSAESHRRGCGRSTLPSFLCAAVLVGTRSANRNFSCAFYATTPHRNPRCVVGVRPLDLGPGGTSFARENETEGSETRRGIGGSSLVRCPDEDSTQLSLLPPWLERFREASPDQIQQEIQWLELSLTEDHGFTVQDAADVVEAVYLCGAADGGETVQAGKILGSITFCKLLLRLEADTVAEGPTTKTASIAADLSSVVRRSRRLSPQKNDLVSKDVLLASILHYSECVAARYDGVYEQVQRALYTDSFSSDVGWDAAATTSPQGEKNQEAAFVLNADQALDINDLVVTDGILSNSSISLREKLNGSATARRRRKTSSNRRSNDALNIFTIDSLLLAQSASRLKRTEILTNVLLTGSRPLTKAEYDAVRNLLVTLTDDWRALAIRCVASLYRLEAVVQSNQMGTGVYIQHRTQEAVLTAKESLQVYASLSERLGLHRLQTQLEANAFRVLYPRQYSAASALFHEHGAGMTAISTWLANKLEKMLQEDLSLLYELEYIQVLSRVKEPYSFWKKLLRRRLLSSEMNIDCKGSTRSQRFLKRQSKELSILEVNDGVALRVILKARKLHGNESDETTLARERMLCYYVQDLVRSHWPESDDSRVKDYIRYPKANGYQSLHHTSKISRNNKEFVFEVQIRSEEMHRLAEFGVAAHWTYKSVSKSAILTESSSSRVSVQSTDPIGKSSLPSLSLETEKEFSVSSLSSRNSAESTMSVNAGESLHVHALGKARQSLMQSQVYVFLAGASSALEKGQLLSLPVGSLVMDIIEILRSKEDFPYKEGEIHLWKNGKLAHHEERVRNGDMVVVELLIPTGKILANRMTEEQESLVS